MAKRHYKGLKAETDVVDVGGQRGSMMQSKARYENAFGNMSADPQAVAGFPRGVRMEEYPNVGEFMALDNNLGGSREGLEEQMRADQRHVRAQLKPRKI